MPAMNMASNASFDTLEQTANFLANGFETLLSEVECLVHQEQDLKSRLDFAYDEVRSKLVCCEHSFLYDEKSRLALDQELSFR